MNGDFGVKLSLIFPAIVLYFAAEVEAKYCLIIENGQTKHFACGPFQHCCGTSCCENFSPFYQLWYFWLCVMLALIFCSFGGYWYRRHFQHRLLASQHASGHRTMMMFMMNNIHTNNHYDYGGSEFCHPSRCQRFHGRSLSRAHHAGSEADSVHVMSQTISCQAPPSTLSTPPPSYYETVYMPPPPEYAYFNGRANGFDQPLPHPPSENSARNATYGVAS